MGLVVFLAVLVIVAASAVALLRDRTAPSGTTARISVDDLAIGRSPRICAVTGVPTTNLVEVESRDGGASPWWVLLVFLGPIGWVGLAILVALGRRTNRVSGLLPVSDDALARYNAVVTMSRRAMAFAIATIIGAIAWYIAVAEATSDRYQWVAIGAGVLVGVSLLVALGSSIVAPLRWIDLELDGSGRWVTVRRASPMFGRALVESYRGEPVRT